MDNAYNALLELRLKIEENKKLIQKQEEALKVMEEMMGLSGQVKTPEEVFGKEIPTIPRHQIINIQNLAASTPAKKTFKQEIENVVKQFADQEFTVAHVHEVLEKIGVPVNGLQPRARIALILNDLCTEGIIKTTFKGAGSVPNRYKLVNNTIELDLELDR